jgi:superfamily II DNA or RNA helicase
MSKPKQLRQTTLPFAFSLGPNVVAVECVEEPPAKKTKAEPKDTKAKTDCKASKASDVMPGMVVPYAGSRLTRTAVGSTYTVQVRELETGWEGQPWHTQLSLQPIVSSCCPQKPPPLKTASVVGTTLHVPRFFGMVYMGRPAVDSRTHGESMAEGLQFKGTLCATTPPQVEATSRVLAQLRDIGGAMLVLPCGFGKTVCSLWLAHALHRRTLIMVHAEALAAQWIDRINAFLPGARVGRIQQDVCEVDGCDLVVCMIQSLVKREYPPATLATLGLVIVDEAHHVAAPLFSRALAKLPARHVLGLSATPDRADGLGKALEWLMGPIAFRAQRVFERVRVEQITYTRGSQEELTNRKGDPLCSTMLTNIASDEVRTAWIAGLIREQVERERNIIVLSDRLEQLASLQLLLEGVSVARVVGGTKAKDRDAGFSAQVILSTYHYASEGIDIPRLDTLVMATPRGAVEQTVGRILRPFPNKKEPLVLDVKDPFSLFEGMAWKRFKYYKDQEYKVFRRDDVPGATNAEEEAEDMLCS